MGKAPKRSFKSRANPLGVAVVQGAATAVSSKEEVPVLLKKLGASDANDRVWAAASASNLLMSGDAGVRRMLLAHGVVGALVERLSDSVPDAVVQASGALCSLAAMDQGAAEELSRTNIYAAIQALVPRLAQSIDGVVKQGAEGQRLGADARKIVFLTTDNLLSILRTLCETVPSSLKQINGMALIPFLISFFKVVGRVPVSLVQTAGQFLHTLTDENAPAKRALLGHADSVAVLCRVAMADGFGDAVSDDDATILRVLAGAILINLKELALNQPGADAKLWEDATRAILQTIAKLVSFDTHAAAVRSGELVRAIVAHNVSAMDDGAATAGASVHEQELDRLCVQMDYVQLALELAANIFADDGTSDAADLDLENGDGEDEDDEDEDEDEDDENDSANEDENQEQEEAADGSDVDFDQADMSNVLGDEDAAQKETEEVVRQSILGVFIDAIIPPLLRLAEPTRMSVLSAAAAECAAGEAAGGETAELALTTAEAFVALHERALGCFSNFLLVLEESLQPWFRAHPDRVGEWWGLLIAIAEHLVKAAAPGPADLSAADSRLRSAVLEPATGCMWTLARNVGGAVPATPDQIEGLIHICEAAPTVDLRVKAVGALGNIARRQPGFVDENRRIGQYLLEHVVVKPLEAVARSQDAAIEPIVEALDLLFDVYGDMAYDYDEPVFVRGGFLARLRQLPGPMRKLVKAVDRRKNRGLRDRSDLAAQNLRAFVDYKASERR
ncbi:hypothetical protein H4R18_004483 [Coemansia javaensis]|uniref:SYO1-like TPR repeats domain-containing protein n=1 Tax=Coemansia javaensis TaxID=2761396 RepID=A0A9W8H9B1_9FUNG|nr:hypothetical protein H4R18_004483 [Coemansia javaensis]